jgi:excisionase family DNA binding protein
MHTNPNTLASEHTALPALPNLYCTIDEFAANLQVSRGTVFGWVRAGLPSLRVGRCRRIIVAAAYRWLEAGGADRTRRSPRAKRTMAGSSSASAEQ